MSIIGDRIVQYSFMIMIIDYCMMDCGDYQAKYTMVSGPLKTVMVAVTMACMTFAVEYAVGAIDSLNPKSYAKKHSNDIQRSK